MNHEGTVFVQFVKTHRDRRHGRRMSDTNGGKFASAAGIDPVAIGATLGYILRGFIDPARIRYGRSVPAAIDEPGYGPVRQQAVAR